MVQSLFTTPLGDYNVLLHLKPSVIATYAQAVTANEAEWQGKTFRNLIESKQNIMVDFDPVWAFVRDLQVRLASLTPLSSVLVILATPGVIVLMCHYSGCTMKLCSCSTTATADHVSVCCGTPRRSKHGLSRHFWATRPNPQAARYVHPLRAPFSGDH